jgi:hypothetical protein
MSRQALPNTRRATSEERAAANVISTRRPERPKPPAISIFETPVFVAGADAALYWPRITSGAGAPTNLPSPARWYSARGMRPDLATKWGLPLNTSVPPGAHATWRIFMRNQSVIEMMGAYASATGLPPTGIHRRLTDHLIMRMGVRCGTCRGDGVLTSIEDRTACSKCHRFGWRLTAAEVRRIHQIVTARFPELRNTDGRLERAVSLWGSKRRRAMGRSISELRRQRPGYQHHPMRGGPCHIDCLAPRRAERIPMDSRAVRHLRAVGTCA